MPEINVNNLSGVQWWMKKRSSHHLKNGFKILIIVCVMALFFCTAGLDTIEFREILFLAVFFLFFVFFSGYQFYLWRRSLKWSINEYWYGTIVDMRCIRNKKKKIRGYRITADVNGKEMEGVCLRATYNRAVIGDRILLFRLEGDKVFCVHPDE